MKKFTQLLCLLACTAFIFSSCKDNTEERPYGWDYGTVIVDNATGNKLIMLDGSGKTRLVICPTGNSIKLTKYNVGTRLMAEFYVNAETPQNPTYQYEVDIFNLYEIPTKAPDFFASFKADTLANDPFVEKYDQHQTQFWVTDNYLTLTYLVASTNIQKHTVALASYWADEITNNADTVSLEFRHNANGDTYRQATNMGVVSFKLDRINMPANKDSVTLAISMKMYTNNSGDVPQNITKYITYKKK